MPKMYRFQECYQKTRTMVRDARFMWTLPKTRYIQRLSMVMGKDGPNRMHYGEIKRLRSALRQSARGTKTSEGTTIVNGCENVHASFRSVLTGSNSWSSYGLSERVAAIKMLRHMYLVKARGGQEVWVYSPPKKYTEWVYDELEGFGSKTNLAYWTNRQSEVYSRADKKAMGDATQLAQKWAMSCIAKLGSPDERTLQVIHRWFLGSGRDDDDAKRWAPYLLGGMKKIAAVLNSHKLVLSDEPIDRNGGGWKDYAFVYKGEQMSVIYIQKATLDAAKGSKMWDAALTIIHELSHRELNTDDHRYGDDGGKLGPSSGAGALSERQAYTNADNWGYFAADMNRALRRSWRNYVSAGV